MTRAALFVVVAASAFVGGCPLDGNRDGIGVVCDVDGAVCPFDHTCVPDDPDDPSTGLCAPILDYGTCPDPAYAQKAQKVIDDDLLIDEPGDLLKLEDVSTVQGRVKTEAPGAGGLLAVGDLCAFEGLQRIDGALVVSETDATSLDGLQGLAFVGGGVLVHANGSLEDVMGLQNLAVARPADGRDFGVFLANNRNLDEPAIQALKDALEASAPTVKVFACGNKNSPGPLVDCPSINDLLE